MAEFQEVMKQKKRMCEFYEYKCSKCEVGSDNNGTKYTCSELCIENPQQAEEIIMKFSKEHPMQTNADKFKEVFGFESNEYTCPYKIDKCEDI